ncbi:MAG: hypothetical protein DGJ47_000628 [Rickettsiaceae bacterium]
MTKNTETENLEEENENAEPLKAQEVNHEEIIEALTQENQEFRDKLVRQMAETENVRNRNIKTIQETRDYAILGFAKDLVSVMDNLSRALEHIPSEINEDAKNVIEGIKMTQNELNEAFKKNNIEQILPKAGDKFDYNLHCAISQIETDEVESGKIVNIMQNGYKIKDRLLRAASVIVAK